MRNAHITSFRTRATTLALFGLFTLTLAGGCDQGHEGDRCNPYLSYDECDAPLVCSGPSTSHPLPGNCVENYCCPADPMTSANPYCNGSDSSGCLAPTDSSSDDAATVDAATDAASSTSGDSSPE